MRACAETVMETRTKILGAFFGVVIVWIAFDGVIYPSWIEPLVTLDERIAARRQRADELAQGEQRVQNARKRYQDWVVRSGSQDLDKVGAEVRDRLNTLIEKHKLEGARVTPGSKKRVGKTSLYSKVITVMATCTLESGVAFLKDIAELPQLVRVNTVQFYPATSSGRSKRKNQMSIRVPVEIWVLGHERLVGAIHIDKRDRPDVVIRHQDRDYERIWSGKPFRDYVPPIPLRANAGPPVRVLIRQRASLAGSATGGDRDYTYAWTPTEGLRKPNRSNPQIDTKQPFSRTYTMTVTDGTGETATTTVQVNVSKPPEKVVQAPSPPPPPPPEKRWKNRKYMQIRMALLHTEGENHVDELMVYNSRAKEAAYHGIGEEFDGGELVFVHPTGGLVRRRSDFYIYPTGEWLDQDLRATQGLKDLFPELVKAADWYRGREAEANEEKARKKLEDEKAAVTKKAQAGVAKGGDKAGRTKSTRPTVRTGKGGSETRDASETRRARRGRRSAPAKNPGAKPKPTSNVPRSAHMRTGPPSERVQTRVGLAPKTTRKKRVSRPVRKKKTP